MFSFVLLFFSGAEGMFLTHSTEGAASNCFGSHLRVRGFWSSGKADYFANTHTLPGVHIHKNEHHFNFLQNKTHQSLTSCSHIVCSLAISSVRN